MPFVDASYTLFITRSGEYASVPPAGAQVTTTPSSLKLTAEHDSSQPPMGFVDCIFFRI